MNMKLVIHLLKLMVANCLMEMPTNDQGKEKPPWTEAKRHESDEYYATTKHTNMSMSESSGVLLGDRGYACQPYLLTPFTDPQEAQQAYNHAHAMTRARVEMTFGLLKARLHKLRACDITVACAVLHNVACLRKERAPRVPPSILQSYLMTTVVG
ncbi:hypothetical protein D5F01_LYC11082 [Larimichthys crocea]|uniref:DDE Tnp4 domain-containing protein n=1 Tax=Larimichthys crocea TaxID=215358 RepID=A0A6G0IJB9_LARCR|nr:hypothetical protein D5F01_LYC11082 [Larimichthys crocea]